MMDCWRVVSTFMLLSNPSWRVKKKNCKKNRCVMCSSTTTTSPQQTVIKGKNSDPWLEARATAKTRSEKNFDQVILLCLNRELSAFFSAISSAPPKGRISKIPFPIIDIPDDDFFAKFYFDSLKDSNAKMQKLCKGQYLNKICETD